MRGDREEGEKGRRKEGGEMREGDHKKRGAKSRRNDGEPVVEIRQGFFSSPRDHCPRLSQSNGRFHGPLREPLL